MAKPRSLAEAVLNINRVLKFAERQTVLIGIPADKAGRTDSGMTNAGLAYIHEYGAPEANIPARPFLGPGMEKSREMIAAELRRASEKALSLAADGDVSGGKVAITEGLNRIGLKAASNVQGQILAGLSPPLAERTIKARPRRGRTGTKPLLDTGQLLRSITYVIRN